MTQRTWVAVPAIVDVFVSRPCLALHHRGRQRKREREGERNARAPKERLMSKWFLSFKFVNQQVGIYNPRQLPSG